MTSVQAQKIRLLEAKLKLQELDKGKEDDNGALEQLANILAKAREARETV